MSKIYFLSYFAGGGGASLGAKMLGFKTLGIEIESEIAAVYQENIGDVVKSDVRSVDPYNLPIPFPEERLRRGDKLIVQYSPPCQEDSNANRKGDPYSSRANILRDIFWHLDVLQPDAIFLENVSGYINSKSGVFHDFCEFLRQRNYIIDYSVVDAADFGIPQNRERLILRAWQPQYKVKPLRKTHERNPVSDQLSLFNETPKLPWIGWYEAIADLIPNLKKTHLTNNQKARVEEKFSVTKYKFLIDTKNTRQGKSTIRPGDSPAFCVVSSGIPKALLVQRIGYSLHPQAREALTPSLTVMASWAEERKNYLNCVLDGEVYSLNHLTLARFQSFPDWYKWSSSTKVNVKIIEYWRALNFNMQQIINLSNLPSEKCLIYEEHAELFIPGYIGTFKISSNLESLLDKAILLEAIRLWIAAKNWQFWCTPVETEYGICIACSDRLYSTISQDYVYALFETYLKANKDEHC